MQGWDSSETARLPLLWPRFDSRARRHMWVEFVVCYRPCAQGFSRGSSVLLPPQKNQQSKFQFDPQMKAAGLSALLLSANLTK